MKKSRRTVWWSRYPALVAALGLALVSSQVVLTYFAHPADPEIVTAGVGMVLYPMVSGIAQSWLRKEDDE